MTARTASPSVAKAPREERYTFDNERVLGPLMLAPAIIYIVALVGFPLVLAVLYAFSTATAGDPRIDSWDDFVGLRNFRAVLNDGVFTKALRNTIAFTVISQIIVIVLANILAMVLTADFKGKRLVRFIVLLPWTTPVALGVLGWFWMLDSVYSPIDWLMRQVGLLGQNPLGALLDPSFDLIDIRALGRRHGHAQILGVDADAEGLAIGELELKRDRRVAVVDGVLRHISHQTASLAAGPRASRPHAHADANGSDRGHHAPAAMDCIRRMGSAVTSRCPVVRFGRDAPVQRRDQAHDPSNRGATVVVTVPSPRGSWRSPERRR